MKTILRKKIKYIIVPIVLLGLVNFTPFWVIEGCDISSSGEFVETECCVGSPSDCLYVWVFTNTFCTGIMPGTTWEPKENDHCFECPDASEICTKTCTTYSMDEGDPDCAPNVCMTSVTELGACTGGDPEPDPRYPCEARNMTCPASCNLGERFDFSYEVRRTDYSYRYLGRQFKAWRGSWYEPSGWCWDTTSYSSTWEQVTKRVDCNYMSNNGANNNMNLNCYAVDEAGTYCGSDPDKDYDVALFCKVDVYCAPDETALCCDKSNSYYEDASATLGDAPGAACLGATDDSCWASTGGFSFPDTLSGDEVYNDSCCGDDTGEYFVSDSGIFQGSRTITSADRSCDGTTACCRSDSGDYNGYVKAGSCVDVCSPTSIGHIRIWGPSGLIKLNIISAADAISEGRGVVKVAMTAGDTSSAADLVETTDPEASPVRIMTPYGIKAWRELP